MQIVFESVSDLARPIKRKCPENNGLKRKREHDDKDIPPKRSCVKDIDIEEEEDLAFQKKQEQPEKEMKKNGQQKLLNTQMKA